MAFPWGRIRNGLLIGLQAIGRSLENRTSLTFGASCERSFGGFVPRSLGIRRACGTLHASVTMNEDVADTLMRMAESGEGRATFEVQGCSLIALATHGRGGLQRWIVGSITERVLAGSKLPLLIVRPQKQQPPVASESTVGETTWR